MADKGERDDRGGDRGKTKQPATSSQGNLQTQQRRFRSAVGLTARSSQRQPRTHSHRLAAPPSTSFQRHPPTQGTTGFSSTVAPPSTASTTKHILGDKMGNSEYFYQQLEAYFGRRGITLKLYRGGPVDLHQVFVQVLSRGGFAKVCADGRVQEVCDSLGINIGAVDLVKLYISFLYNFEISCGRGILTSSTREPPTRNLINFFPLTPDLAGSQPQSSIQSNQFQRGDASSLPPQYPPAAQYHTDRLLDFSFTGKQSQSSIGTYPYQGAASPYHQNPAQSHTVGAQNFTYAAQRSSSSTLAQDKGLRQQQVPLPLNFPAVASQAENSRAQCTESKQTNFATDVPGPSSSVQQASLQSDVGSLAQDVSIQQEEANFYVAPQWSPYVNLLTEADDASIQKEEANFSIAPRWSSDTTLPTAGEPGSHATQVSAQTVSQTTQTQTLLEARLSSSQMTDPFPREDPATTLGANSGRPANTESIVEQQHNKRKAEDSDGPRSERHKRQSRT